MNRFQISGKVIAPPTTRMSKNGKPYALFEINHGDKSYPFCAFGHTAKIATNLKPGDLVEISGELSTRPYTDRNGNQRNSIDMRVTTIELPPQVVNSMAEPEKHSPLDDIPF